jgi:parvulin-like peptidyl-prolyl isomerase
MMTEHLRIGNFQVPVTELVPLLVKYQMLPGLLRELVIDRGIRETECSDTEKVLAIKQFCERQQLQSNEQIQQWLAIQGLTPQQMEEIALRQFKIEKFKRETWSKKAESHFLSRKDRLDKAIYSLIRTNDIGIAQEIYFRLIDGEQTFEEIARKYSQGAEAQTGGLIGPVELSTPHPVISKLITTNPIGKICAPIKLEQWYVIVRPEQLIPAQFDDAMRDRLVNELFQGWLHEQIQTAMAATLSIPEINAIPIALERAAS